MKKLAKELIDRMGRYNHTILPENLTFVADILKICRNNSDFRIDVPEMFDSTIITMRNFAKALKIVGPGSEVRVGAVAYNKNDGLGLIESEKDVGWSGYCLKSTRFGEPWYSRDPKVIGYI